MRYATPSEVRSTDRKSYDEFLHAKACMAVVSGFDIELSEINSWLKPHAKLAVQWAIRGGRRALFESFGLAKTSQQLEILRIITEKKGGRGLIVAPLGVRQEFKRDAEALGITIKFIRSIEEANTTGLYITNYETVRDGKLDPNEFIATSLDEASVLRGFGKTKTFRQFMRLFANVAYRFVATATPSPNEFIEMLSYSAYLGVMDVSQAKTRFFKRDSTKADKLRIHPHKEREFWLWVASWALFVNKPSDITRNPADDIGYDLPEMIVRWHEVQVQDQETTFERDGQKRMFREPALGISEAAREKRRSLPLRIQKLEELLSDDPQSHCIIWHDLESERHAIKSAIPDAVSIYGKQDLEEREGSIVQFSDGQFKHLSAKPVIAGSGCNFQRHCHRAIYLGIGFKFNDFIQSIHRVHRFLQEHTVEVDIIYTDGERAIRKQLERKWQQHERMVEKMTQIIKEYGLSEKALHNALVRALGVERVEVKSGRFTAVNNDCVHETKSMLENSIDLILTSIPFATQYEYSPNYADFGHTDNNDHFFEQMDYLTPELLRMLKPGRLAAIHVKDRIVPGGMKDLGFQTVYPFHVDCIMHFMSHGFAFMGMKTIVTDVVRENNQTYRLGWTEQCKDGTKMGFGMPEYLLLFRKAPTSNQKSYADEPVVKSKEKYSRSRWQIDAHGFTRSNGNRILTPEEIKNLPHDQIFQWFRKFALERIYDFEYHVKVGEELEAAGRLPSDFMLLQPPSPSEDVWTDITRMRTLNGQQHAKGRELHLCPLQFDICDRVIEQMSNEGETVLDPFAGIMSVPYRAILKGRKGIGIELSKPYFLDGLSYCRAAEEEMDMPSLFDTLEEAA